MDQVELIFSLFVAQNADKKISDLFHSDAPSKQVKIGSLTIRKNEVEVRAEDNLNGQIPFSYNRGSECFSTWDDFGKPWYSFDIMKYISLEDKV